MKTNNLLDIRIEVSGTIVTVDVLSQDPSITARSRATRKDFIASNGIRIASLKEVGAYNTGLYLKGYGSKLPNQCCSAIKCSSKDAALQLKEEYLFALKEWKENNYFTGEEEYTKQTVFSF